MNREIKIIEDIQKLLSKDKITPSDADELFDQLDSLLFSDEGDSKKIWCFIKYKNCRQAI
ncbi:hypothetical protein HX13_01140 [Chryseobacterium sp. P1-3]|uniref:hypothetical protein n=1 Tax=Chryseobacterium sp. (strain P1-3) TaxID=1517683 RepID=UPI0004E64700|nr:hypothetical protein [Chryseobacterium sp. P1-3]KFF75990.1 hypothetical protein HX13_01140 [Chryseobacterium sp. P1-3]